LIPSRAIPQLAGNSSRQIADNLNYLATPEARDQAIPADACDRNCDCAERCVLLVLIPESLRQNLNQNGSSLPLPAEQSSWQGQSSVLLPVPARRLSGLTLDGEEISRRDLSQVGILRDLIRAPTSPFREIAFRQSLQPPGDPPKQMSPMPGSRFFPKHLSKFLSEGRQACPAQLLNFHQYRVVHSFSFLSVTVNHSHMDALCRPTSKAKLQNIRRNEKRRQDEPGGVKGRR
jgi:hypothetical protein